MEVLSSLQVFKLVLLLEQRDFLFLLDVFLQGLFDFLDQLGSLLILVLQIVVLVFGLHFQVSMIHLGLGHLLFAVGSNLVHSRLQSVLLQLFTFLNAFESVMHLFQIKVVLNLVHPAVDFFDLLDSLLGQLGLLVVELLVKFGSMLGLVFNALQLLLDLLLLHLLPDSVSALLALRHGVVLKVSIELHLLVFHEVFKLFVFHLFVLIANLFVLIPEFCFEDKSLLLDLRLYAFSPFLVVNNLLLFFLNFSFVGFFSLFILLFQLLVG